MRGLMLCLHFNPRKSGIYMLFISVVQENERLKVVARKVKQKKVMTSGVFHVVMSILNMQVYP